MTLTPEEIEIVAKEATEFKLVGCDMPSFHTGYATAATKYLTQLKEERERSKKLLEALRKANTVTSNSATRIFILNAINEYENNNQ